MLGTKIIRDRPKEEEKNHSQNRDKCAHHTPKDWRIICNTSNEGREPIPRDFGIYLPPKDLILITQQSKESMIGDWARTEHWWDLLVVVLNY